MPVDVWMVVNLWLYGCVYYDFFYAHVMCVKE